MEFNPSKCEHITFTMKRSMSRTTSYTLHNQVIPKVDNIKYLGVKMEKTLKWNLNTDYIRQKAASTLGFIRRNIPFNLPQLRARAYIQLMRSEEHTSELQSPCYIVCRLLLENKNKKNQ